MTLIKTKEDRNHLILHQKQLNKGNHLFSEYIVRMKMGDALYCYQPPGGHLWLPYSLSANYIVNFDFYFWIKLYFNDSFLFLCCVLTQWDRSWDKHLCWVLLHSFIFPRWHITDTMLLVCEFSTKCAVKILCNYIGIHSFFNLSKINSLCTENNVDIISCSSDLSCRSSVCPVNETFMSFDSGRDIIQLLDVLTRAVCVVRKLFFAV